MLYAYTRYRGLGKHLLHRLKKKQSVHWPIETSAAKLKPIN
jgi:hypothetical protein